jgi:hypothetical protein
MAGGADRLNRPDDRLNREGREVHEEWIWLGFAFFVLFVVIRVM